MSRCTVMTHNLPSWVAGKPSKTGRSAVRGFGATRQNGAFCLETKFLLGVHARGNNIRVSNHLS